MDRVLSEQHIRRRTPREKTASPRPRDTTWRQGRPDRRAGVRSPTRRDRDTDRRNGTRGVFFMRVKTIGLAAVAALLAFALFLGLPFLEQPDFSRPVADESIVRASLSDQIVGNPGRSVEFELTEDLFYEVSEGETLSEIGSQFDLSTQTLVDHNDLADPDQLEPGQILRIPARL